MSKELIEALEALRTAGNALLSLSDTIEKVLREAERKDQAEEDVKEEPQETAAAGSSEEPDNDPADPAPKFSEVKALLTKKSRAGFTKEVKELLKKYGADRLSAVDPSHYEDLMKEAEVIGNAG